MQSVRDLRGSPTVQGAELIVAKIHGTPVRRGTGVGGYCVGEVLGVVTSPEIMSWIAFSSASTRLDICATRNMSVRMDKRRGQRRERLTPIEYLRRHLIEFGIELLQQRFYLRHHFSINDKDRGVAVDVTYECCQLVRAGYLARVGGH